MGTREEPLAGFMLCWRSSFWSQGKYSKPQQHSPSPAELSIEILCQCRGSALTHSQALWLARNRKQGCVLLRLPAWGWALLACVPSV